MNTDWRNYPFRLVHNDSALDFPAAEGEHVDQESDTWFIAGELTGATGRSFAFLTIFNKNRPGGTVVADFYTMSLFDCDTGEYGTYTDYDMPPKNMQPDARPKMSMAAGYLDIRYESSAGPVAWTTCRDDDGELLPYTYRVSLRGVDQARPVDGTGLGRHANPRAGTRRRGHARRQDHLLRPARHLLVLPDRDGDAVGRCAGVSCMKRSAAAQDTSIGSGFPNTPAAGEPGETRAPGRTNGARSTWTTAST